LTPTQLFRAALTLPRTQQSFETLNRHATLDREGMDRMFRRNVREADADNTCGQVVRFNATRLLRNYYLDTVRPQAHGETTQLTE
jgi:hypothetical protein